MKKLLYIPLLFLLVSCYNQQRNCSDFKTGKFKFEYEVDGVMKTTYFERFDSYEVDEFEGKVDTSYVRWVNDCEYILQKKNPKNREEKKAIHMKILTTEKDSYTFEFSILGNSEKQKGTVYKIN